jgi:UDP-N-acetylmuramoylalanine--D-glutamate ligase
MDKYVKAKKIIFANQDEKDFAVLNFEDEIVRKISADAKSKKIFFSKKPPLGLKAKADGLVFYENGEIVFEIGAKTSRIKPKVKLPGLHNIENILAASAAAFCAGINPSTIERAISLYKGMPHRIEFVKRVNGTDYYNDSKATNVDSTRVALEAFGGSILLIMGGQDKGFPYSPLKDLIKEKVKAILLVGEAAPKIKRDLKGAADFYDCRTIEKAVSVASKLASRGDIVLLSPACASWDQFKDFEERGDVFKRAVLSCLKL